MLTNNKSAKLSVAELFNMNWLLFFLSSQTDGRLLVLRFTGWISLCQGCPRKLKTRRCNGLKLRSSERLSGQGEGWNLRCRSHIHGMS